MRMCCSKRSIGVWCQMEAGPRSRKTLQLLQPGATQAFVPAELKALQVSTADPNAAGRLWHMPIGKYNRSL